MSLNRSLRLFPLLNRRLGFTLCAAVLLLAGCDKPAPPPPPPAEVLAVTVTSQTVPVTVQFVAQVESSHQVEILARVSGFLDKILYKEGALVKAGQLMFQIDPKPFQAAVSAAKGEVANREAQLWTAKANLDRVKPLAALDAISKSDLDNATGDVQSAEAALYSARANLDKAQLDLGYTTIHAPVTGVSGQAFFREGTYLTAGATGRLSYVAQIDPIWVTFSVSQNQMAQRQQEVASGKLVRPADLNYQVELELSDGTLYPFAGKLNFVSPTFNRETGTFLVRAELPNANGVLRPGMFVKANVKGDTRPNAMVVPQKAVQETSNGHVVYLAGADGKAEIRPVIVGDWVGNDWVIKEGLKGGEQIIVDGFQRLAPGASVKAVSTQKQGAAATPAPATSPAVTAATPAKPAAGPAPVAPAATAAPAVKSESAPTPAKPMPTPAAAPAKPAASKPQEAPAKTPPPPKTSAVAPAVKSAVVRLPVGGSGQLRLGILATRELTGTERFARDLGKRLGQPVEVLSFENEASLADWFQLYQMLDLAIIPSGERGDLLVGNYQLLQQLEPADNSAPGPERLVAHRDLPTATLKQLTEGLASLNQPSSSQGAPAQVQWPIALAAK
jgi:membrane fusion protein (multidrug efflux system)